MGETLKILKRKLRIFFKIHETTNILKNKHIPKHGEARDPFKNIFCIHIEKKSVFEIKSM